MRCDWRAELRRGIASETKTHLAACDVVAQFRSAGRLTLHRGRAWTFMPADLAGQNAPQHRTFSKILGSGDRPYIK
eukprot:scaffold109382_cov32-Phaeocystis_antarctica.AAC.1